MGSLNQDGSRISQDRKAVKNIGGSYVFSADRSETEIIIASSVQLGTESNESTSQYSVIAGGEQVKVNSSLEDVLISRASETGVADMSSGAAPIYAINGGGGGGGSDLESILAEGNTGSGIVLTEKLTTPRIDAIGTLNILPTTLLNANSRDIQITYNSATGYILIQSSAEDNKISMGDGYFEINSSHPMEIVSDTSMQITAPIANMDFSTSVDIEAGAVTMTLASASIEMTSGKFDVNGIVRGRRDVEVVTIASGNSITLTSASGQVICVKGNGPRTILLPANANPVGLIYDIKDADGTASSGNITVDSVGNDHTFDGASSFVIDTNHASYTFVFNGTEWNLI